MLLYVTSTFNILNSDLNLKYYFSFIQIEIISKNCEKYNILPKILFRLTKFHYLHLISTQFQKYIIFLIHGCGMWAHLMLTNSHSHRYILLLDSY